ncbi:MAG: hypothetical protein M9962_08450 [Oligoflexia bacterium]|nr:hypothetical protein [Oligoflexia bacterium]
MKNIFLLTLLAPLVLTAYSAEAKDKADGFQSCTRLAYRSYYREMRKLEQKNISDDLRGPLTQGLNNELSDNLEICKCSDLVEKKYNEEMNSLEEENISDELRGALTQGANTDRLDNLASCAKILF